jgi:hypothetical protein
MNVYTYGTQAQVPFANKIFLQNCLDYLINLENGLSDAKAKDYIVGYWTINRSTKTLWQIINIVLPILVVLLLLLLFSIASKKKFSNK